MCLKMCHLNILSWQTREDNVPYDEMIQNVNIISFNEKWLQEGGHVSLEKLDLDTNTFKIYCCEHKGESGGGVMMIVDKTFCAMNLKVSGRCFEIVGVQIYVPSPFNFVTVYHYLIPNKNAFISTLYSILNDGCNMTTWNMGNMKMCWIITVQQYMTHVVWSRLQTTCSTFNKRSMYSCGSHICFQFV